MFARLKTILLPLAILAATLGGVSSAAATLAQTRVGGYRPVVTASRPAESAQVPESQQASAVGWPKTVSECCVAAKSEALLPGRLYHYTQPENVAGILKDGLQPGRVSGKIFTTAVDSYSPIEAQMYLALPPNRGLSSAMLEIDVEGLRAIGVTPATGPLRVLPTANAMGGGTEILFTDPIPPSFIRLVTGQ